jgi:hypothetical protein
MPTQYLSLMIIVTLMILSLIWLNLKHNDTFLPDLGNNDILPQMPLIRDQRNIPKHLSNHYFYEYCQDMMPIDRMEKQIADYEKHIKRCPQTCPLTFKTKWMDPKF